MILAQTQDTIDSTLETLVNSNYLEIIKNLVNDIPNDTDLGFEVRKLISDLVSGS